MRDYQLLSLFFLFKPVFLPESEHMFKFYYIFCALSGCNDKLYTMIYIRALAMLHRISDTSLLINTRFSMFFRVLPRLIVENHLSSLIHTHAPAMRAGERRLVLTVQLESRTLYQHAAERTGSYTVHCTVATSSLLL